MLPFTRPSVGDDEISAVVEVLRSGWITSGPRVSQFEAALGEYIGEEVAVRAFNSGTSALEAALLAANIGCGDEVIVPAISFVATANVVLRTGARPVFVDVDLHTRNMDAEKVSQAVSPNTRAVMPVHFSGLPVDLDPIYALAEEYQLIVIEDAAHAIGTTYKGRKIGAAGNPVCFSFHPNKNMTTIEGGALACGDPGFVKRIERIRFHGIERNDLGEISVPEWGGKMNLPDVGAAMGLVQLPKLDGFNQRRQELARRYFEKLTDHPALIKPGDADGHSWHMFCICLDTKAIGMSRPEIVQYFQTRDINVGTHYPAMHLFPLYRRFGYGPGDLPNAERIGEQTLTLPLFPSMQDTDVDHVCDSVHALLAGKD